MRAAASTAPLPAVAVLLLVAVAPFALLRGGRALGQELAPSMTSLEVATALVLGPCLAAAVAGAVVAASLPTKSALGPQIAAGPCDPRSALAASLFPPAVMAALVVLPSLLSFSMAFAASSPGGWLSGLALAAAILSALPAGAVAVECVVIALRGPRLRLLALGLGTATWLLVGASTGVAWLGLLAPAALAVRGTGHVWVALVISCAATIILAATWIELAARRREPRSRATRRRHLNAVWRRPVLAAGAALAWRRPDVRRGVAASVCFGVTGAGAAAATGAAPPGPLLLATTTTLLGSLVAALTGAGGLVPGLWLWRGAPYGGRTIATTTWLAGLIGVATPVAAVGVAAAAASGAEAQTVGVVAVLAVAGAAVATVAGALVPWRRDCLGGQVGSLSAFAAVAVGASLGVGLVAPRLAAAGIPDPATALVLCTLLSGLAVASLHYRLEGELR